MVERILETICLRHNNENYDIQVMQKDNGIKVRALKKGKPINPYWYSVDIDIEREFRKKFGEKAIVQFLSLIKMDIDEGRLYETGYFDM